MQNTFSKTKNKYIYLCLYFHLLKKIGSLSRTAIEIIKYSKFYYLTCKNQEHFVSNCLLADLKRGSSKTFEIKLHEND